MANHQLPIRRITTKTMPSVRRRGQVPRPSCHPGSGRLLHASSFGAWISLWSPRVDTYLSGNWGRKFRYFANDEHFLALPKKGVAKKSRTEQFFSCLRPPLRSAAFAGSQLEVLQAHNQCAALRIGAIERSSRTASCHARRKASTHRTLLEAWKFCRLRRC
jgi:hypothetical protein